MNKRPTGLQVVWFLPRIKVKWTGIRLRRYTEEDGAMRFIYKWILCLGFLEIRKWQDKGIREIKDE